MVRFFWGVYALKTALPDARPLLLIRFNPLAPSRDTASFRKFSAVGSDAGLEIQSTSHPNAPMVYGLRMENELAVDSCRIGAACYRATEETVGALITQGPFVSIIHQQSFRRRGEGETHRDR